MFTFGLLTSEPTESRIHLKQPNMIGYTILGVGLFGLSGTLNSNNNKIESK